MNTCKRIIIHLAFLLVLTSLSFAQGMPSWVQDSASTNNWTFGFSGGSSEGPSGQRSFGVANYNGANYMAVLVTDPYWDQATSSNQYKLSLKIYSSDPQSGTNAAPVMLLPLEYSGSAFAFSEGKVDAGGAIVSFVYGFKDLAINKWRGKGYTFNIATQVLTQVFDRDSGLTANQNFPSDMYWGFVNQSGSRAVFVEQLMAGGKRLFIQNMLLNSTSEYAVPNTGTIGFAVSFGGKYKLSRSGNSLLFISHGSSTTLGVFDLNNLVNTNNFTNSFKHLTSFPGGTRADISTNGQAIAFSYTDHSTGISKPAIGVIKNSASGLSLLYYKSVDVAPFYSGGLPFIKISPDGRSFAVASYMALTQADSSSPNMGRLDIFNTRDGTLRYRRDFYTPTQISDMDFGLFGKFIFGLLNASSDSTLPTLFGLQIGPDSITETFQSIPHPTTVKNVKSVTLTHSGQNVYWGAGYSSWTGGTFTNVAGFGMGLMP